MQLGIVDPPAAEVKAKEAEFEYWKKHIPTTEEVNADPELLAEFWRLFNKGRGKSNCPPDEGW